MPDIKAVFPKYSPHQAPLMRRLAGAVVAQWENLPPEVRELLLEQAVYTYDVVDTVQLKQQISSFVQKHQGWPPAPSDKVKT
jgi:hypothetical protein